MSSWYLTRRGVAAAALLVVLAACGGNSAASKTSSTGAAVVVSSSTAGSITVATTPPAAVATTASSTTLAPDAHPVFGIRWADVWPDASMRAVYRVTTFGGQDLDLPARMEYGVDFADGTYDRFVVGTPEPGNDALVIYFDRSVPWEFRVVGEVSYSTSNTTGPESMDVFQTPMMFSGLAPIGETRSTEGVLSLTFGPGDVLDLGVIYDVTLRGVEAVTVLAGDFEAALVVDVIVGGDLIGGTATWPVEVWLDAEQFVLKYVGASGFDSLELLESWG